jgi:hypothetical protein
MAAQENVLRFFGKHVALLECLDETSIHEIDGYEYGEILTASGFIACLDGHWFFVTAGHVFQDWADRVAKGNRLTNFSIDDTWGAQGNSTQAIPFDYASAFKNSIFDEKSGSDVAVLFLEPYYVQLLRKNGIEAIDINRACPSPVPENLDGYFVLGCPSESSIQVVAHGKLRISRNLTLIKMKLLDDPPQSWNKGSPRFFGKIDLADVPLNSIRGMSGGPIIGIRQEKGQMYYYIIALQSTWNVDTGNTTGSYIFGAKFLMQQFIERVG